jgi:hypothetical protein
MFTGTFPSNVCVVLIYFIATISLLKGAIGLVFATRFYRERHRQYESKTIPGKIIVSSSVVILIASLAWIAPWDETNWKCWAMALFLTALALLSVKQLGDWPRHRLRMLKVVDNARLCRAIDLTLVLLGGGFFLLNFFLR